MIRNLLHFGVSTALAVSILSTQAAGILSYDNHHFPLPSGMDQLLLTEDCENVVYTPQTVGETTTCVMKARTYASHSYQTTVTLYNAKKTTSLETPFNPSFQPSTENFLQLLEGKVEVSDFYDEDGLALRTEEGELVAPLFSVVPSIFRGNDYAIRDLEPISHKGKVIGYSFTPLERTGDFPSLFTHRTAVVYEEKSGIIAAISTYFNTSVDSYSEAIIEKVAGGKEAPSQEDVDFYINDTPAFLALQNEVFEEYYGEQERHDVNEQMVILVESMFSAKLPMIFPDVLPGDLFANAMYYMKSKGIVDGYEDGKMLPNNSINRAEFIKILVEATHKGDLSNEGKTCFSDVAADAWYAKYVCYAKEKKIIEGYPDGTFGPAKNINLAEALKIVFEAYVIPPESEKIAGEWYEPYLDEAQFQGFTLRMSSKMPGDLMTRAEMSELIARAMQFNFYE